MRQVDKLKGRIFKLEKDNTQLRRINKSYVEQMDEMRSEIDQVKSENKVLRNKVDHLRNIGGQLRNREDSIK